MFVQFNLLIIFELINISLLFFSQEVKTFETIDELETFLLKHGENIVDLMGGEIDRIEMKLRVSSVPVQNYCEIW